MRIQYKFMAPIYVFPEMRWLFPKLNYNVLSPSSHTHISVRDLYIGTEDAQFPEKEYINGIFVAVGAHWDEMIESTRSYKYRITCSYLPGSIPSNTQMMKLRTTCQRWDSYRYVFCVLERCWNIGIAITFPCPFRLLVSFVFSMYNYCFTILYIILSNKCILNFVEFYF